CSAHGDWVLFIWMAGRGMLLRLPAGDSGAISPRMKTGTQPGVAAPLKPPQLQPPFCEDERRGLWVSVHGQNPEVLCVKRATNRMARSAGRPSREALAVPRFFPS